MGENMHVFSFLLGTTSINIIYPSFDFNAKIMIVIFVAK